MPSGFKYIYSTNTALTDPTAGKLKFDSVTPGSITSLRISDTDDDASNLTSVLQLSVAGRFFVVQKDSDPSVSILLQLTDNRIGHTGWEEFPVTVKTFNGTLIDGDVVRVIAAGSKTVTLDSVTGPAGRDAGLKYAFSTDVTATDPTAGVLKFDNATLASVTELYISETDGDANAIAALLAELDSGSGAVRSTLVVRKEGAPANIAIFAVNAARTDNSGWKTFPVTFIASNGSFLNTDTVKLELFLGGGGGSGSGGLGSSVSNSGAISLSDSTPTALTFDTEAFVDDTQHELITHPSRLTANTTGRYLIIGNVAFASNSTGRRQASIQLNAGAFIAVANMVPVASAISQLVVSVICELTAGDYVELVAYQTSGGPLDVSAYGPSSPVFSMVKV